jgi:PQQ-dependent catabolism-associated CXXCW motif protein
VRISARVWATTRCMLGLMLMLFVPSYARADEGPDFDPATGYRVGRYRAPTPEKMDGATRIFAADVDALVKDKNAVLIDVMPSDAAGLDTKTGQWRLIKKRLNIPGSTWLPDVGKGALTPQLAHYFKINLEKLSNGDTARALIFYCQSDCWMSWNAVRRAQSWGYTALYWFPDGTDGWRDWDGKTIDATPLPAEPAQ